MSQSIADRESPCRLESFCAEIVREVSFSEFNFLRNPTKSTPGILTLHSQLLPMFAYGLLNFKPLGRTLNVFDKEPLYAEAPLF